jgi:hypothetical protein
MIDYFALALGHGLKFPLPFPKFPLGSRNGKPLPLHGLKRCLGPQ